MKAFMIFSLFFALVSSAFAQQESKPEPNPVTSTVRKLLERQSKNLMAAAEEMPAEKYAFKPTPPQMSFGHLLLHITNANNFVCSKFAGDPEPAESKLKETDEKAKLIEAMKDSFNYCATALNKVDDSKLGDMITLFGDHKVPRAAALIAIPVDLSDHYGAAAIYLRLNGLLPPTAKAKK